MSSLIATSRSRRSFRMSCVSATCRSAVSASSDEHQLKPVDQLQVDAAHDQLAVAEREPHQHRLGLGGGLHPRVEILDLAMLARDDSAIRHGVGAITTGAPGPP